MTIGLYKYYHFVHNISSVCFHGNRYWPRFIYTKVSFFTTKIFYFKRIFLKNSSIDFFYFHSFDQMTSIFKHIEKFEMSYFLFLK